MSRKIFILSGSEMIQIQFRSLVTDNVYRDEVQEEFAKGFAGVTDPELRLAVAAYCFWLAVPQPTASLTCNPDDLVFI